MSIPRERRAKTLNRAGLTIATASTDHIADRAYELFLLRGREHGRDMDDWLQAERELAPGLQASSNSPENQRPLSRSGIREPV